MFSILLCSFLVSYESYKSMIAKTTRVKTEMYTNNVFLSVECKNDLNPIIFSEKIFIGNFD